MNKVKNAALKRAQEFGWDEECIPTSIDQEIEGSNLGEDEVKLMWAVFDALNKSGLYPYCGAGTKFTDYMEIG